jgi:hypothetical protein
MQSLAVVASLLGAALAGGAQAAEGDSREVRLWSEGPALRPVLGAGITVGGSPLKVQVVNPETGDVLRTDRIKFGQFWQFYGGVAARMGPRLSLQATYGYHMDSSSETDANFRFSRYPIELLAHYRTDSDWLLGGGLRYVTNVKFVGSGSAVISGGGHFELKNTTGAVIEAEYRVQQTLGLKLRYVAEKYEFKAPFEGQKVDGNHVGLLLSWYL